MQLKSFYFSRILGNKIYTSHGKVIGTLKDLAVDINYKNPKIAIAAVKTKQGLKFIDFNNITVSKEKGQYVLICSKVQERNLGSNMLLKKYILDKQIIDVNGRKVDRANDIRLTVSSTGMFIAAVDIGMDGLLRRIGIAKPLKKLGFKVSSKLMLWDNVETAFTSKDILLSKTYNNMNLIQIAGGEKGECKKKKLEGRFINIF
ncbi:PRC-barrel domain-containing protein [Clostridium sp. JN-9]|uniref:PRC-barrel domain-containing protein n=1 Tax=Clostridium sp. JN-9 TaxID=2507159 RepID=UPI000FFE0A0C|nr:PRC-barrel domain-containing protein [Clostridium sp. JN-9]QAT40923.1 hypothetical protein EQM05_11975 [Clostridium sp. JN-9]